jgi:hypothetical protein
MPVLRLVIGAIGVIALGGALIGLVHGAPVPAMVMPALVGIFFLVGAFYERVHYKLLMRKAPGRGFVATPERFVDPASGRLVEVHVKPDTGERAYVDVGPAPPHAGV